tara:strand:+ start:5924 stop:6178 length:255 start_codon:yes stop_codon:yes gene_type:complete
MDKLKFVKSEFKDLTDVEKKLQLGKLQVLETIVEMLNCMRESITRELYVNGCEDEKDILDTESTTKDNAEEKITYNIKDLSDVD